MSTATESLQQLKMRFHEAALRAAVTALTEHEILALVSLVNVLTGLTPRRELTAAENAVFDRFESFGGFTAVFRLNHLRGQIERQRITEWLSGHR
jgi:hypothetical protein